MQQRRTNQPDYYSRNNTNAINLQDAQPSRPRNGPQQDRSPGQHTRRQQHRANRGTNQQPTEQDEDRRRRELHSDPIVHHVGLIQVYYEEKQPVREPLQVLLYHGTTRDNARLIREHGFRASRDGQLGEGIYLAREKKALGFARNARIREKDGMLD
jgi:hypothetical protein